MQALFLSIFLYIGLRGESSVIEDRIDIPQDQYPEINFIGLLIGPRGNTLKEMEKASGAKIMIRGKGSVKPGKGRQGGQPVPGEDEELHALIRAPDELSFKRAIEKINKIIKMVVTSEAHYYKLFLNRTSQLLLRPLSVLKNRTN
jgi:hypothetical protein